MKKFSVIIILAIAIFAFTVDSFAYVSKYLNIKEGSVEMKFLNDAKNYSLEDGSIIASGLGDNLKKYRDDIKKIDDALKKEHFVHEKKRGFIPWLRRIFGKDKAKTFTIREKSSIIFDYLHKNVFKNYDEHSTTLDVTLKTGKFNCVTATVLYNILLKKNGIKADIAKLPTHVFTQIKDKKIIIDVENATPFGFDIGAKTDTQKDFQKITGYVYFKEASKRIILDRVGIFFTIYGNRAAVAAKTGFPLLAFQNSLKAYALAPTDANSLPNVVGGYAIYSADLVNKGDFAKAVEILEEGIANTPKANSSTLISNYQAALDAQTAVLVKSAKYDDAISIIEKAQKITGEKLLDVEENLYARILVKLINNEKDYKKAYTYAKKAIINQAKSANIKNLLISGIKSLSETYSKKPKDYSKNKAFFLQWYALMKNKEFNIFMERYFAAVAEHKFNADKADDALGVYNEALSLTPKSEFLNSKAAEICNKIATKYAKAKSYAKAIKYNKLGLKYLPKESSFINNMAMVYREWAYSYIEKEQYTEGMKIIEQGLKDVPTDNKLLYYKNFIEKQK